MIPVKKVQNTVFITPENRIISDLKLNPIFSLMMGFHNSCFQYIFFCFRDCNDHHKIKFFVQVLSSQEWYPHNAIGSQKILLHNMDADREQRGPESIGTDMEYSGSKEGLKHSKDERQQCIFRSAGPRGLSAKTAHMA